MSAPVRSMTGYARVRRVLAAGELVVSLRSVNHRGLDLQFHLPPELDPCESAMRKLLSSQLGRGHVDVRANFSRSGRAGGAAFNRELMNAWLAAFRRMARDEGLPGEPDLNAALAIPGMLADSGLAEAAAAIEADLLDALREALDRLNQEREREGAGTARLLEDHRRRIAEAAAEMQNVRASVTSALHQRLAEKLGELLKAAAIDPARLAQEAAILADRSDISEETARLDMHAGQIASILSDGGETGKRLEFLVQEMHREANTILSKSNAAGESGRRLAELALAVKSEIEKIREQSLNLE